MKSYTNEKFDSLRINEAEVLTGINFTKCEFDDCQLSAPKTLTPDLRTKISNSNFLNCVINGRSCSQRKIYLESILFENIKTPNDLLRISGAIFNKVIFKGKFDRILLSSSHYGMLYQNDSGGIFDVEESQAEILNKHVEEEYKKIEWALDISEAEFKECDLRESIPANLIKRNPETQILLKFDKVIKSDWESIQNSQAKYFCSLVNKVAKDRVIVASVRNKKDFKVEMEAIHILRSEGIADLN